MAIKDVKKYYYTMLGQYTACKNDLADFEQAFRDGYITEDKLTEVNDDVLKLKENLDRIQYIMYLFNLPVNKEKKTKYLTNNQDLINYFTDLKVDTINIKDENANVLAHLKKELKKLAEDNKTTGGNND